MLVAIECAMYKVYPLSIGINVHVSGARFPDNYPTFVPPRPREELLFTVSYVREDVRRLSSREKVSLFVRAIENLRADIIPWARSNRESRPDRVEGCNDGRIKNGSRPRDGRSIVSLAYFTVGGFALTLRPAGGTA